MYLLLFNCTCSHCFKLWLGSHIWYYRQHTIRQWGKRKRPTETWWELLQYPTSAHEVQLQPNYATKIVHFLQDLSVMPHEEKERTLNGSLYNLPIDCMLTALFYSLLIPSSQRWAAHQCCRCLSQMPSQMSYLACTSLSEIRLLLNILFFILFISISFDASNGKVSCVFWQKG